MSDSHRRIEDKLAHIEATLGGAAEVSEGRPGGLTWADLRFLPRALPEVNLHEVDTSSRLLGKEIAAPFMISPMTGGIAEAGELNRRMAGAAQTLGIPFGVGSQRVALEDGTREGAFEVRSVAPTIPIFANLGAIQLTKGYGIDHARRAIDMIEADGIYLHLNAMQEVVQEGGDVQWSGVLSAIERLCDQMSRSPSPVPVWAREVGFGLTGEDTRRLLDAGISGLDCAGGGGTSWTRVEGLVAKSDKHQRLGQVFAAWGLTTPESIREVRSVAPGVPLAASGGIRSGLDVAKCVGLGADLAGLASPVLQAAQRSREAVVEFLQMVLDEFRATLFGVGARNLAAFRERPRLFSPPGFVWTPSGSVATS